MGGHDNPECPTCGARLCGIADVAYWCPQCGTLKMTQAVNVPRLTQPLVRDVGILEERVRSTAEVPCVRDQSWRRYQMKCFPNDPCSFCRARGALAELDAQRENDG